MTNPPPRERERDSSSPPVPNGPRSSTFQSRYRYTAEDSQHVSPDGLATLLDLYKHDDRNGRTRHQTSIYAEYWGKQNGAITLGVLHLAYSPDEGPMPDEPDHPDVMRAEYERIGAVLDWMIGERGRRGAVLTVVGQPGSVLYTFINEEAEQLVVVALQMTVSKRHSVNINGILPLYVALGRFASEAEFVYAFVTPDEETGRALVKPSRPALPAKSPVNSTRSSSSNAVEPFTWSRAFVVIDPKKPVQHVEAADD
ncbi:hypothetical protein JCM10296v2_003078 [Rhodotorula toruloides]